MSIKVWFLTAFREMFVYHHKSLEFRAEVFAVLIAPNCKNVKECDCEALKSIAELIYANKYRQEVFINTVKEYIAVLLRNPLNAYNEAIKDINRKVKTNKEFAKKIEPELLKRFLNENLDEEKRLLQTRIYEFLEEQSKTAA